MSDNGHDAGNNREPGIPIVAELWREEVTHQPNSSKTLQHITQGGYDSCPNAGRTIGIRASSATAANLQDVDSLCCLYIEVSKGNSATDVAD